ncbi:MAG: phage holin family protein [Actinobacteria bacterium]|nr:phage holin family protein [Actinomycetota bacterium]
MSTPPDDPAPRSLGQLVSDLSEQGARLVRAEIDLAKAEVTAKAQQLGIGVGLLAFAGFLAVNAFAVGLAAAVLGLSTVVAPWLAALIVMGALLLIAGILVAIGVGRLKAGSPPVPELATQSVQADVEAVTKGLHR